MTEPPLLEAVGISAGYGTTPIVSELQLHVGAGEVVALLGPNGAGKTTTLMTLAGALPALAGDIRWLGQPTTASLHARARAGTAFVTEDRSVFMQLTVRDNLRVGRCDPERAFEIFPELRRLSRRRAGLLSGGEQQMLTLGRAFARRPRGLAGRRAFTRPRTAVGTAAIGCRAGCGVRVSVRNPARRTTCAASPRARSRPRVCTQRGSHRSRRRRSHRERSHRRD